MTSLYEMSYYVCAPVSVGVPFWTWILETADTKEAVHSGVKLGVTWKRLEEAKKTAKV